MGLAAEAKKTEAKDPPILQLDKKEYSPHSTRMCKSLLKRKGKKVKRS